MIKPIGNNITFTSVDKSNDKNKILKQADTSQNAKYSTVPIETAKAYSPVTCASPFYTDKDLTKFQKTQQKYIEDMSKRLNMSVQDLQELSPKVILGDAKQMTALGQGGAYDFTKNIIEINPVKEINDFSGGIEPKVVHETFHGLCSNLRKEYLKSLSQIDLINTVTNQYFTRMLNGESGVVYGGVIPQNVNGQAIQIPFTVKVPSLNKTERQALIESIYQMQDDDLDLNTLRLNEKGTKKLDDILSPKMESYIKSYTEMGLSPKQAKAKALQSVSQYVSSFFARRNNFLYNLAVNTQSDNSQSAIKPLSKEAENLAKNSLNGFIDTLEGNLLQQYGQVDDNFNKKYFTSFEELNARVAETEYRLEKVNTKINNLNEKGFSINEKLLKEKAICENNKSILDEVVKLHNIEEQIVSADKDMSKVNKVRVLRNNIIDLVQNTPNYAEIETRLLSVDKLKYAQTHEEARQIIKENLPSDLSKHLDSYLEASKQMQVNLLEMQKVDKPELLLADTPENKTLIGQFETVLNKIKTLSLNSDVQAMPKSFYSNEKSFLESAAPIQDVILKWTKKLL